MGGKFKAGQELFEEFFDPDDLRRIKADMAPGAFPAVDDDIETQYRCPACAYEWSGNPKPPTTEDGDES